ncbi:sodium:solute symporter family transporter [Geoalkalibacter halelectricus]|uniref:Cation acetate symporter n=1 Tax=Geoalkalibacter halelectricus TaxID=2847045 RepID=A0ABY5ZP45_9BACT|nr:cation acetate symporter [Geoalkalibacter halelectricus]MDO3377402.1 cation acetate symporter [Geoalkalibacter halelectricus]UWZ80838.1 cation acetate symporter [Geoalkalibacter halelectricus]
MTFEGFKWSPALILFLTLGAFLAAGLFNRIRGGSEYYPVSGGTTGVVGAGASIASNWMSAASLLGIAGIFYLQGYFALAYVIGWTGGYVLLLILLAGQLRRFGKFTAPEFVEERYDSPAARLLSAIIAIIISLIYCVAQYKGIGLIFSWIFGFDYTQSLLLGAVVVMTYIVLAGTLGANRNQKFHYTVLILFFIVPLMFIAAKMDFFWLVPQFGYGTALQELSGHTRGAFTQPFAHAGVLQWCALAFTLMVGTAGLPHVLSRFYTAPNLRDARWSVLWGIFFIGLLYWSAPAYAIFARIWQARRGIVPDAETARQTADIVVIMAGEWVGLPLWLTGIIATAAIAAAFSTVTGLLITGAGAFSYDIYFRLLNPNASQSQCVKVAKGATLVMALVVVLLAVNPPGLIAEITAVAFALAGNTLFPVFVLGIWWDRTNKYGAIAGMLTGIMVTFSAFFLPQLIPALEGILHPTSSAFFGVPLVFGVMIGVSLLTPPPPERIRRFLVEKVHTP